MELTQVAYIKHQGWDRTKYIEVGTTIYFNFSTPVSTSLDKDKHHQPLSIAFELVRETKDVVDEKVNDAVIQREIDLARALKNAGLS